MVISHNVLAMNANRQLGITGSQGRRNTERLSSGYRVNRAADDAAGLSISEKMRKQIRGLNRASENAEEGISLVQTAEGALGEVQEMLQRMNELSVQAANGLNSAVDRGYIQDEVDRLKFEIDRVAQTAKFNEVYLLNGALGDPARVGETEREYDSYMGEVDRKLFATELTGARKGQRISLDDIHKQKGLKIVYAEITHEVNTTQSGSGNPGLTGGTYDPLRRVLETEIVPQAVKGLLDTFTQTYGYLANSSIGIGLNLYNDSTTSTLASVTLGTQAWFDGTATPKAELTYKLSVNVSSLLNTAGNVDLTNKRNELETTIIHEMMHAMMDEVHTNGMIGSDGYSFSQGERFPDWFVEGNAQAAAGGCFNGNDWVNGNGNGWVTGTGGLGIDGTTSLTDIANRVKGSGSRLGSGTSTSQYATGYLACMYLGYLANGGGSVTQAGIRRGLDKILSEIRGNGTTKGKSLNRVISEATNGKYNGISSFENSFGDNESAVFISRLVNIVGSTGTGGLVADFSAEQGILPDAAPSPQINLFKLDPNNSDVTNRYPPNYPVMSGGSAWKDGTGVDGTGKGGTGSPGSWTRPGGTNGAGGTGRQPVRPAREEVTLTDGLKLQVGAERDERMTIYIEGVNCWQIGVQDVDVMTEDSATRSIDMVAFALDKVSRQRSRLGAYQNRLEHMIRNLDNVAENTQAAEARIRDTDMAREMVQFSNNRILQQAGESVLVQATQMAQGVMRLLA